MWPSSTWPLRRSTTLCPKVCRLVRNAETHMRSKRLCVLVGPRGNVPCLRTRSDPFFVPGLA